MEVTFNWLPPILDPIVTNPRAVTVPLIDILDGNDLGYGQAIDNFNIAFDWTLRTSYFILSEEEYPVRGENHILSAMTGMTIVSSFSLDCIEDGNIEIRLLIQVELLQSLETSSLNLEATTGDSICTTARTGI